METTPIVQGVMCATKSKEDSDLEFQSKAAGVMEMVGKMERDNKLCIVDRHMEFKKLYQNNQFKQMDHAFRLQELKTNAQLKLKELAFKHESKLKGLNSDLSTATEKELNDLLDTCDNINDKEKIMKLQD